MHLLSRVIIQFNFDLDPIEVPAKYNEVIHHILYIVFEENNR